MTHPFLRAAPRPHPASPSWRERLAALRYVPSLLRMVWQTHRGFTAAIAALRLARAFVPVATLWVGKLIIDAVVAERAGALGDTRLWLFVAVEIAIVLAGELLARGSAVIESLLGDLFSNYTSVRLMEHAATLDLHQFEDPAFYDQLERARRQTVGRIGLLTQLLAAGQDVLTLGSLAAALFVYSPWLLLLLVLAVVPSFVGETHYASLEYSLLYRWTPERRRLDYLRYLGASDRTAREVQMFGLAPWLVERYRRLADRFYEENRRLVVRKGLVGALLAALGTLGYYAAYAVILLRTVRGLITIGSLTFLAGAFSRSRDLIQRLLLSASDITQQALYLKDMFDFLAMRPTIASRAGAPPVPAPMREGFIFEDVGFRYPESERWAVRHVSFALRAGERIALVGENGAGKTTLIKLLARLYDPTEGRILLDGRDLREYDLDSVRRAIGVIFQDFVRFDMRFGENVAVGEIGRVRPYLDALDEASDGAVAGGHTGAGAKDAMGHAVGSATGNGAGSGDSNGAGVASGNEAGVASGNEAGVASGNEAGVASGNEAGVAAARGAVPPEAIVAAAEQSLASSLLPRLPAGYAQMLGRRFEGGVDLSGGEWQKVALARAYLRDAQVLILDEPTAALDARAEYEVFRRFAELVAGRAAVLISHRFSTVRMADRILVLRQGEIVEEGSHHELVARGGVYAELFGMQAAGYR